MWTIILGVKKCMFNSDTLRHPWGRLKLPFAIFILIVGELCLTWWFVTQEWRDVVHDPRSSYWDKLPINNIQRHIWTVFVLCCIILYCIVSWCSGTPFGQLPILEVDGVTVCQSGAINSFLARKFGKYNENLQTLDRSRDDTLQTSITLGREHKKEGIFKLEHLWHVEHLH